MKSGAKPEPAHAGVHFDVDRHFLFILPGPVREGFRQGIIVDDRRETQSHDLFGLFREDRAHDQDRGLNAGFTEFPSFLDKGNAEHVRAESEEALRNPERPVAVGLRLDNGENFSLPGAAHHFLIIVRKRAEVDLRERRPVRAGRGRYGKRRARLMRIFSVSCFHSSLRMCWSRAVCLSCRMTARTRGTPNDARSNIQYPAQG